MDNKIARIAEFQAPVDIDDVIGRAPRFEEEKTIRKYHKRKDMKVRIKLLNELAQEPFKANPTDAGWDLTATSIGYDEFGNICYGTGIAMEIPEGYVGLVFPRSSICKYEQLLTNSVGVIDSHYRGEITAKFAPTSKQLGTGKRYQVGDRICQIIIIPFPEIEFEEAEELSQTDRGVKGYGSSGR